MNDLVKLADFYEELERHDWYYYMSDSFKTEKRGADNQARLAAIAARNPAHQELFDAYKAYMFSGPNFNKPVATKPERPKGE
jgi:hypothetical protein